MKKQVKQFEPVSWFCSAEIEVEEKDVKAWSEKLDKFCQSEVEKSEQLYMTPPTIKGEKVVYDEYAQPNIKEDPFWKMKPFYEKSPDPKGRDDAKQSAELDV